jgi:hypothetical protein
MDTKQIELIERLRRLFQGEPSLREVSMFGGRSFMVDGKIVVGAMKAGDLLVRIPPERHPDLIAQPGVSQPAMGAGRSMGPSWISVTAGAIDTDEHLRFWGDLALDHVRATGPR